MSTLNQTTLSSLPSTVKVPSYGRKDVITRILHFGVGNFHRAHQAIYCERLLNSGYFEAGIMGVSLRSAGMRDTMAEQDYLYTEVTLSEPPSLRVVSAIQGIIVAPETPSTVSDYIADSAISLITSTITEKGYYLQQNAINFQAQDLINDLKSLEQPKTIYGYIAAGLIARHANCRTPITILCCDNIQHGGNVIRTGVTQLIQTHAPHVIDWLTDNVAFIASMVDRITPATTSELRADVETMLGVSDNAPVAAEPFTQWVIENKSAGSFPPFENVGALLVSDITVYEQIKLTFLNATHSILATLGALLGDTFVHEAIQRPALRRLCERVLSQRIIPVTQAPENFSLSQYSQDILARFANAAVPYAVLQVGSDSSLKIQQRWFPTIDRLLAQDIDADVFAFILASWVHFIQQMHAKGTLQDPCIFELTGIGDCHDDDHTIQAILALASANDFAFYHHAAFMHAVSQYFNQIKIATLDEVLDIVVSA